MKKLLLSLLAGATALSTATAQDSTATPLTISGSVDTYYRTSLNTSDKDPKYAAPLSSFANGAGFNIGMINLVSSKEGEKSGFVADLVFGPRGASAGANDDALNVVNQLYAYYNLNDKLTFTMGRFNTYLGYEVISPASNFNYSTSHLFSYGPFSHTGAKLNYAVTDKLSVMVAALDQLDYTSTFTDRSQNNMMYGAQIGYSNDALGLYINYLGGNTGPDGSDTTTYNQIDLTAGLQATDDFYVGLNATIASQATTSKSEDAAAFSGLALYAQYAMSDAFSLGFRGEYVSDKNTKIGLPSSVLSLTDPHTKGSVIDLTLSGRYQVGDLTFIPEIRTDMYSEDIVLLNGDKKKGISSISLAAVYAF